METACDYPKKKLDLVEERYAWKNFQWPIPAIGDQDSLISRWPRAALIKSLSMARTDEIFTEFADDPGLVKVKHCRDVQEKCKRHNNSRAINIKK